MSRKKVSNTKKVVVKSLVDAGLPYREISETVGVSLGYITEIVKEFEASKELVAWFKQNKGDILLKAQAENLALQDIIRKTVTKEEIETWTPDQRQRWFSALGVNFGIVYDKTRLECDESTQNHAALIYAEVIRIRDKMREEEEEEELKRKGVSLEGVNIVDVSKGENTTTSSDDRR